MDYIKLEDCVKRKAYKIHSRNLSVGIFDGDGGFVGLRDKFGLFLFTEYHWDHPSYATVRPLEDLNIVLPDNISLEETLGTVDHITNREVEFDKPISDGGRGWYYKDTNEASTEIRPVSVNNKELFNFLMDLEKSLKVR